MKKPSLINLPAAAVTGLYVLLFAVGAALLFLRAWSGLYLAATILPTALLAAWAWDLNLVTARSSPSEAERRHKGVWIPRALLGLSIGLVVTYIVVASAPYEEQSNGRLAAVQEAVTWLLVLVVVPSYLALLWSAAAGLTRSEQCVSRPPWHLVVGTFLLIFYLPIGIWFLRNRVEIVLSKNRTLT